MNWAVTISASALQRGALRPTCNGETLINLPFKSFVNKTIAETNAWSRYTSRSMATVPKSEAHRPGVSQELRSSTAFLLKRLGFAVKERTQEAFEPTGLTPYHHAVLSLLGEGSCAAQWIIADRLAYDRSQLVGLLDDLEERGFVTRKRDQSDRRRHLVSLTPSGREALLELRAVSKGVEKEFLTPLDAGERRTLHELLLRLAAHHDARLGS
jgi:DNA-binding MarR family transcriptional regulator